MTQRQHATLQHDQPQVENDLYGRKSFAELVGNLLVQPPDSPGIVIGIEGAWGSGKTTVVRYIVEALKRTPTKAPIIVEFNPWMLAGADALVEALLTELAAGIGAGAHKKKAKKYLEVTGKILGYAGLLRHMKYLKYVPGVSFAGLAAEDVGNALHKAGEMATTAATRADDAKKVVEEAEKLVAVKSGLAARKKEVVRALKKLDRSIVVVVDDLDRLTPDEIKAVFRTIKAVADFPRVAYLLAYDRSVVSESLGGGPVAGGDAYIEKIVQVAYPISPAFPWLLRDHFTEDLEDLLSRLGRQLKPFEAELLGTATALVCSLCRYPRDIVRLMNRLTVSLASTEHEVNAADVVVAEALFQRFPKLRESIIRNPEQFTGRYWSVESEVVSTDWSMYFRHSKEEARTAWQAHLPTDESERSQAAASLKFLFPITHSDSSNRAVSHLRISDLTRLIRFMGRTSVDGVHEVAGLHAMLAKPADLSRILSSLDYQEGASTLRHLIAYFDTAGSVDGPGVVRELIRASSVQKSMTYHARDYRRAVGLLAATCLQCCGSDSRDIAIEFVKETPVPYGIDFLSELGMRCGQVRGASQYQVSNSIESLGDSSAVSSAVDAWRARAEREVTSGTIMAGGDLLSTLFGLSHIGKSSKDSDAIKAFRCFCEKVHGGVEFFLDEAAPYHETQRDVFFLYVWDAEEMATLVEASGRASEFSWYVSDLRDDLTVKQFISQRNAE
ncbi:KAP family P-loop NTPase fold protein [Burkholderia sp. LMG 32019]|uniref:KAP family P-loop NTPase fold protein n=1 Tax=Burkholderia sp. LMG 32019 TaxID=3158173 RepID=UPI003C3049F0